MEITIKNNLTITGGSFAIRQAIRDRLTMDNPKYLEAVKHGRWTGHIKQKLCFYEIGKAGFICPRGFLMQIMGLCPDARIIDQRRILPEIDIQFKGKLRPFQIEPVTECLKHDFGLLVAPTGAGKTAMALSVIAERKQPALVLVHTKELLNQWVDRASTFLGLEPGEVGIIGAGKKQIGDRLTISTVQSLYKCASEVSRHIGHLIVDECHRAPSRTFTEAVTAFDSKYMLGLSATPYRRDGLSRVIYWHIGDVSGEIDKAGLVENGDLCRARVRWIETDFDTRTDAAELYSKALSELTLDSTRNDLICRTVADYDGDGINLILTDRKAHCLTLAKILKADYGIQAEVLTGDTKDREAVISRIRKYLIATSQLIGEGFDLPAISSIFLATPVKYHGRLIQYIGRALRPAPGKTRAMIFDFVDCLNPVFLASAKSRSYTYQNQNILEERG